MPDQSVNMPNVARVDTGRGGLKRVVINSDQADAEIYLHGAHVTHFRPRGQEHPVIFLSSRSLFDDVRAIRGGVPICFPWFGPHPSDAELPQHGFARISSWTLESAGRRHDDGAAAIVMSLASSDATRKLWPEDFVATYTVTVGATLAMSLEVRNPSSDRTIRFEEALHTYLFVGDVRRVSVTGLENAAYLDKTDDYQRVEPARAPLRLTGETDRVYLDTRDVCIVDDPALARKIVIEKSGSTSTVVWNPWADKAKGMKDFGEAEWPTMLCVETANVGDAAIALEPGQSHKMTATIRVE